MPRAFSMVFLLLAVISNAVLAAPPQALRIGLLPHLSPKLLLETYRPLIDYLEQQLGQPVIVNTAPSFAVYSERAASGRYDIYLTAPHFAALAAQRDGHHTLARFARQLHGVIVVARDAPFSDLADLRGKTIATPDRLAVITLLGESTLAGSAELTPDRDLEMSRTPSHDSALLAVAEGRADAAVAGVSAYDKMGAEVRARLRVIAETATIPHMMIMASPSVNARVDALREHLLAFNAAGHGAAFFSGPGKPFGDLVAVSDDDLQALTPLVSRLLGSETE
jgi:phosphonate transport system substrate-binding protein